MNTLILSIIPIIISSVSTIIIGISAVLLWKQIKGNYKWNRRKASQEILNNLVMGEFPNLTHELRDKFKCAIWDESQTYEDVVKDLSKGEIDKLDGVLKRFLNILEVMAINIKNDIIDEDICYDYLGEIMTELYRWSKPFIIEMRKRQEPSGLCYFEEYAEKWTKEET